MKRTILLITTVFGIPLINAQAQPQISSTINKHGEKPSIAVPDFRGAGDSQRFMATVNSTLFSELQNSGQLTMVAKTLYPLQIPQQPSDFRPTAKVPGCAHWPADEHDFRATHRKDLSRPDRRGWGEKSVAGIRRRYLEILRRILVDRA